MFEGIISDLLNRVLGTYIENLDCSKLKISIWGGDVELKDLIIKQSALDELQLPVRPVFGYLKRLCLKIPWSKLYTERWEASIDGLCLIVVPNASVTYDAAKEEQSAHETKVATLVGIEEAKTRNNIKELGKDMKKQEDGFMEKLIAQVIRNIEVQITSIHIRYEDSVTCSSRPFAAGIHLQNLSLQSTDANWKVGLDTAKLIYKVLKLNGFLVYWSPDTRLFSQTGLLGGKDHISIAAEALFTPEHVQRDSLKPVFGPLDLTARLQLNPRPEAGDQPFSVPKASLDVVLGSLFIAVSRHQYNGMMSLLDSLDSMQLSSRFRKFRPSVHTVKGNSKLWWKYALECKLESIRRVRRNWTWSHIQEHRERCRHYKALYKLKLSGAKLSPEQKGELDAMERALDVFNITLVRKQAEMEQEREGLIRAEAQQKKGWFGGWLSWGSQEQTSPEEGPTSIVKQFQAEMNRDEKQKLFQAIGYSEEGMKGEAPLEYVDLNVEFLLEELQVKVEDELLGGTSVCLAFTRHVLCNLKTRSAASSIKLECSMLSFDVLGLRGKKGEEGSVPPLVESPLVSEGAPLIDVSFETNPLHGNCGTRLWVTAQPLNITYHSATVAHMTNLFAPPKHVSLQQLQAAALMQLEVVKERSVAGLQVAIENHSVLNLNVNIKASRIFLPELGYFKADTSMIVLNLGSITIRSQTRSTEKGHPLLQKMSSHKEQEEEEEENRDLVLRKMRSSSYDCFSIHLKDVQVVVVEKGEDWLSALTAEEPTSLHLLRPLSLRVNLYKCLVTSDPNLPKVKVDATLPEIALSIIDKKIIQAAVISQNCFNTDATTPLYEKEGITPKEEIDLNQNVIRDDVALVRLERSHINPAAGGRGGGREAQHPTPQFTELVVNFTITEIVIEMLKAGPMGCPCVALMSLSAREMSLNVVQKTFDLNVELTLSEVTIDHLEWGRQPIVKSEPAAAAAAVEEEEELVDVVPSQQRLLSVTVVQVSPKSPDIYALHASVTQKVELVMTRLTARLEQAALLSVFAFVSHLEERLAEVGGGKGRQGEAQQMSERKSFKDKEREVMKIQLSMKEECPQKKTFEQKFSARLGHVDLSVSKANHDLVTLYVKGLSVDVTASREGTLVLSRLEQFSLIEPDPRALHAKLVSMEGAHAWDARVRLRGADVASDLDFFDVDKFDVELSLELGTPRIVFLNKTVVDLMAWFNKFQAAKESVVSASQAAAQAAKDNLSEAYSTGTKVKLDLVLKAPVVFIPHNSSSAQGILLDLGKILIRNKVELGEAKNELGHPCVLDKLSLEVQNVKISRKQSELAPMEATLLEPFCLQMDVVRNLSVSWFTALPEVELKGSLEALQMRLSENDMSSVLAILEGNLGETPTEIQETSTTLPTPGIEVSSSLTSAEREQVLAEYGKVFKKLSLQFTIKDIILTLFTSPDASIFQSPEEGCLARQEGLAQICLKGFTIKTDIFSDFNVGANFILYDCILQDIRKDHEGGITRMMEKKASSAHKNAPCAMVDLTFHQGKRKDIFVDLKISEFLLVLHLPFLLRIQKFFAAETARDMADEEEELHACMEERALAEELSGEQIRVSSNVERVTSLRATKGASEGAIGGADSGYESVVTVQVKVEEPDIVLVDDLSNMDAACIFLHAEIKCNMKMSATQRNITSSVTNLQMYTTVFNPARRTESLSQILTKSDMTFHCGATAAHADNIQIKLGQLNFKLAPDTVELVMSIVRCLSMSDVDEETPQTAANAPQLFAADWTHLWDAKPIDFAALPHLHIDLGEEAGSEASAVCTSVETCSDSAVAVAGEALCLELECLLVTLEAGCGTLSIPLIKMQSDCCLTVEGFYSSQVSVSGQVTLEMAYYNPRQAIWEPLLEPVERKSLSEALTEHQPWRINFEGMMAIGGESGPALQRVGSPTPSLLSPPSSEEFDVVELDFPPPLTEFKLIANDSLEFTVTKTFLEVLSVLSESFLAAYKGTLSVRNLPKAPYKLINKTGLTIAVGLRESGLKVSSYEETEIEQVVVESGGEVDLFESASLGYTHRRHSSLVTQCQIMSEKLINLKIVSVGAECLVPVTKADKRFFSISSKENTITTTQKLGLVTSVNVEGGCKVITLSGCVQVTNELDTTLNVYYMTEGGNEVEFVVGLEPKESSLLPLHAVYTPTAELFFSVKGYSVCIQPLVWRRLQNYPNLEQELHCQPRSTQQAGKLPFMFSANCEMEQIFWGNTSRRTLDSVMMDVSLRPCVVLNNLLPVAVSLLPPGTVSKKVLVPGSSLHINHAQIGALFLEIEIYGYRGSDWKCGQCVEAATPELSVWTFRRIGIDSEVTLDLGLHITKTKGVFQLSLYCPFWMVNKTGFDLTYKTDSLVHSVTHERGRDGEVALFSFRSKSFFGKKKANIRVPDSDWSEKFPLDAVATAAAVSCKSTRNKDLLYQFSIDIQLSASGLTKIVTLSPFYKIINRCFYDLQYCLEEDATASWHDLPAGECSGMWPPGASKALKLRVSGTTERTAPIHFDAPHTTLFKLKNKYGGIFVEVSQTEGGTLVSLDKCIEGATAALVLNHLRTSSLAFWQEGHTDNKTELGPQHMTHFTWESAQSRRLLFFSCLGGAPITIALNADSKGVIENGEAGWATWMCGAQRYVILSEDLSMLVNPAQSDPMERVKQQLEVSFNSIGVSLVNDVASHEIFYLSMASSGVVWEHRKDRGKKYRPFTEEQTQLIEKAYHMYSDELKVFKHNMKSYFHLKSQFEVDFSLMKVFKPFNRHIRRVFQPGVWMQTQILSSERNFHLKLNKVQLDNQLGSDVMFPVVLARVPPPKGVMAETVPKPFFEVSVVMSLESPIFTRFKYVRLLIQEFHVKVELPFIYAVLQALYSQHQTFDVIYSVDKFEKDSAIVHQDLRSMVAAQKHPSRRDFYHNLHLSPIKMHLSFSLTGLASGSNIPIGGQVIHLFLQSVGVTLTEVQDVVFRLGFFERGNCWLNLEGLQREVASHYANQVVKQLYVLVLGLDVLGNPFGLVIGVTKGFGDLFYEPIQGAVEGPGEFAEGLFYGMRSFMGKTVGGAAGAFSRITGTIGKGVASLTLDEDYQRRRREEMHKKPADGLESFARGGKGVLTGMVDGVTGVFTKPISGAKEEGVEGFFKGVGKGVIGLVTRPASGVIDFASGSLDAVMRATDSVEEASLVRPPRYINVDGIIRPFQLRQATGAKLLKELEKGRYAETDSYVTHGLTKGERSILLASDNRLFLISKNDLMGQWKIEWIHAYDELGEPPILCPYGLRLTVKQAKKKMFGVFGGGTNSKELVLHNSVENRLILDEITEAFMKSQQNN